MARKQIASTKGQALRTIGFGALAIVGSLPLFILCGLCFMSFEDGAFGPEVTWNTVTHWLSRIPIGFALTFIASGVAAHVLFWAGVVLVAVGLLRGAHPRQEG